MDLHSAAIVFDEFKLSEPVHEEAVARTSRAHHFGECFLADLGNEHLGLAFFTKVRQRQKCLGQPLLAGIEELIHQILLRSGCCVRADG